MHLSEYVENSNREMAKRVLLGLGWCLSVSTTAYLMFSWHGHGFDGLGRILAGCVGVAITNILAGLRLRQYLRLLDQAFTPGPGSLLQQAVQRYFVLMVWRDGFLGTAIAMVFFAVLEEDTRYAYALPYMFIALGTLVAGSVFHAFASVAFPQCVQLMNPTESA